MLVISYTNFISVSSQSIPLVIICKKKGSGDFYIIELLCSDYLGSGYFIIDGNLPLESILP